jgi:hypothetical protein
LTSIELADPSTLYHLLKLFDDRFIFLLAPHPLSQDLDLRAEATSSIGLGRNVPTHPKSRRGYTTVFLEGEKQVGSPLDCLFTGRQSSREER